MFFEVKNLQTNKSKQSIRLHENEKMGKAIGLPQIFFCKENGYFAVVLMSSLSF